jgi:RNA polymerase sigma factor (sigma-70 family)
VTDRATVEAAIVDAYRREWAFVLAAAVRVCRDLDLAEECVQEAYATALESWARDGIPGNPAAWLTLIAKRRAMDVVRQDRTRRAKLPLLVVPDDEPTRPAHDDEIADDRLRLVFTCCHPALPSDGQVALTLRLVCGVTTPEIARAFLVSEPTMAARITRAKKKIAGARIPYRVPRAAELPDRLRAVLGVIHLLFTTGHTAPTGSILVRDDLVDRALHLARMLHNLMPDEPEVRGLLALLLVTDARRMTGVDAHGRLLRLEEQDRTRWDRAAIAEADELIVGALRDRPGRYVLQAAIAALYTQAPSFEETEWPQAVQLYDRLLDLWPSPVVALNRTVPLSYATGPAAALAEVEALEHEERLAGYPYLPAIKADLLSRLGRHQEAATALRRAMELTANDAERAFLTNRLHRLPNRDEN